MGEHTPKINGGLLIVAKLGGRKHHRSSGFVVGVIDLEHSRKPPRDSFFLSLLYVAPWCKSVLLPVGSDRKPTPVSIHGPSVRLYLSFYSDSEIIVFTCFLP